MSERSSSRTEPPMDCAAARAFLELFLQQSPRVPQDRAFRAHVLVCVPCRDHYRRSVAGLARARRAAREEAERSVPRVERQLRRRRTIARTAREGGRWRLKTVLIPAGLIFLLCGLPFAGRPPRLEAHWRAGAVEAAGRPLGAAVPEARLGAGEACTTHATGSAWIEGRGGRFELGPATRVLVEDPSEPWVRLLSGSLELEGSLRVGAQLGLVELDEGRASVRSEGRLLVVECASGRALVRNAGIERPLAAGERARLGLGRIEIEPLAR